MTKSKGKSLFASKKDILLALEYLNAFIDNGYDFADAQFKTSQLFSVDLQELTTLYDQQS